MTSAITLVVRPQVVVRINAGLRGQVRPASPERRMTRSLHLLRSEDTPAPADGESIRICYKLRMHLDAAQPLLPIATLAAGVFLLIAPRIVSFAVAVYLIFVGLIGLNGIYHIIN